ncbi:MAG: LuxR C-terminal-related transcriptional regulator [Coxiellaceae bacterium]|nr:LuxR C-terminal-related transcriptional regulator [Coxiellaceae bacterium]
MRCEQISVQQSVQAFYNDFVFIKKLHGIATTVSKQRFLKSKQRYMIVSTLHTFELSRRQVDALKHMKHINSRKKIAERMGISIKTLEDHLLAMRKKMNCNTVQKMFDVVQSNLLIKAV